MLAALCACLLGAQGVLPALHQSVTEHRVCAEHGELIEAHSSHAQAESLTGEVAVERSTTQVRGVPADEHDDHCDCVLGVFLTGSDARRADALAFASPELGAVSKIAAAATAVTPGILTFAPKLSPPT